MNIRSPLLILALITAGAGSVHAQNYGINFLGSTTDMVTGTAGVVPISGYNNVGVGAGDTTIIADDGATAGLLTVSGPGAGAGYRAVGTPPNTGGNASLEDGYFDAGGVGSPAGTGTGSAEITLTFSLLSSAAYDVYIYDNGDAAHPGDAGQALPDYTINGTDYYTATLGGAFTNFVQGQTQATESTAYPSPLTHGNYIEISGVAATGGTLTIMANANNMTFRSPVDGIELIAVPEPSPLALGFFGLIGAAVVTAIRRRRIVAA